MPTHRGLLTSKQTAHGTRRSAITISTPRSAATITTCKNRLPGSRTATAIVLRRAVIVGRLPVVRMAVCLTCSMCSVLNCLSEARGDAGFYLWNHSSTAVVHNKTFQEWFIHDYMLNKVGMSPLVSGFFWDDRWPDAGGHFPDAKAGQIALDTGLEHNQAGWQQITDAYHANMDALRAATLRSGKFAWQLMWTGGDVGGLGSTGPHPIVDKQSCTQDLRQLCRETAPPQTRAMMYALNTGPSRDPSNLPELKQDLANFLLVRGPFAWLGHGWMGCSKVIDYLAECCKDIFCSFGVEAM